MSNKLFFGKGTKVPVPAEPPKRTTEEIKIEYGNVRSQLGEEHLKMRVAESTRDNLTQKLVNLHNEYMDAEKREKAAAIKDTKPVDESV